jgi:hypothetical protein
MRAFATMNQDQLAGYWEHMKVYGESEAVHWWQQ